MPHRPGPVAGRPAPGPAPAQAPGPASGQEDPFGSLLWEGFALNDPAVFWELSGDLFAIYDSQACFVDVNPAWERLLGWQTSQLIGRPGMSFVHPDDRPGAAAIAEQARTAGGRFSDAELRLRAADGSYHWVSCSAYTEGEGWCTVSRDVSERKRAEAARDEAERRTTEAYTMTGLSTWRWEPANDAVALSGELEQEGAARGLRMTLEDTLRLVAPSHRDKIRQAVKRVAAGLDEGYCIRYPTAPGAEQPRWLESRAAAVRAGDGTVYAVQGTTQDVTEAELVRDELEGSRNFNQATLDSLDAHVAVLDEHGTIVFVNGAWSRFLAANGSCAAGVGESYLRACDGDPGARAVATALRRMLAGSLERFELEYPCHSPAEERWFHLTAAPLRADGPMRVVVQHHDITERMQAERAERMRSRLLDKVGAAVVATDLHGKVTGWSNGAEALYGWSEVEALGQPVADLTVPAELRGGMEAFMSRVTRDGHWDVDLELVRKDGSRFTGFVSSSLLSNDEGATVGLVGVSVDATERVAAQEALRETSDYLAAITDGMGEGLIAINDRGDVLYMNPEAEQRLGWPSEDLLGQNLHEKTHYRRADGSPFPIGECPLMNARFEGKAVRVEEDVFYRRDGSPVSISYSATPFEQADGATGAVVVFADITERKRAEWALRASEAQLKAIVENTSAAIYVKRRGDYRYELANPELESVMGVERGWIVGKTDADFLPPEAVEALRATDRRVIEQGEEVTVEEVIPVGDQL
ncbi:MAG TPA: PAS domain S-box protein, partial [Thermoleophilaceae bacterium]|nr:PAS domain S-box protein [Thermoleophilaceae bacterium]